MRHRPPCPTPSTGGADVPAAPRGGTLLDAIEYRFGLLCAGPEPMSVDGRRLGHGLPRRRIGLHELSAILMHPSCSLTARDEAWRLLVVHARTGKECWRVGAVGVAMPGLRFRAYLLSRTCTGDIHAALVAEFLAQLATIDLGEPNVVNGLLDRAMSAARGALRRAEPIRSGQANFAPTSAPPPAPGGHPDFVLAAAVKAGVLTTAEAELIGVTRLEHVTLAAYADQIGVSRWTVYKRRKAAEARIAATIHNGALSDPDAQVVAEATGTTAPDMPAQRRYR